MIPLRVLGGNAEACFLLVNLTQNEVHAGSWLFVEKVPWTFSIHVCVVLASCCVGLEGLLCDDLEVCSKWHDS